MEKHIRIQSLINETEDFINLMPMVFSSCIEGKHRSGTTFDVDNFEMIIQRYSLRMLYHANNFITGLLDIAESNIDKVPVNDKLGFQIGPNIYFEFDAFLYSCKSIFEENILNKGKQYFRDDRKARFIEIAKASHDGFIKNMLLDFRNEAVHLEYWGTSISQVILIGNRDGKIDLHLHSTFKNASGDEFNLIDVFMRLCSESCRVLRDIFTLVIKEMISKHGTPNKIDIKLHSGSSIFKIKDFLD
ncbi:hypothetical protein ACFLZI_03185 [Nitrospirota bacterium]